MKKIKNYISVLLVILFSYLCVGCSSNLNTYSSNITKSMKSVKTIQIEEVITDNEVIVHKYVENIKFNDKNAEITSTTSDLSSSFELKDTSETKTVENVDRNSIFKIDLNEDYVSSYTYEDAVLTVNVSKDNVSKVLNNVELSVSNDAILTFTFEDKKIMSITCTFKTTTEKDVVINASYGY